jgi:LppP/LprE lipoprotein
MRLRLARCPAKGPLDSHASARGSIGSTETLTLITQREVGGVRSIVLAMFVAVIWITLSTPQQAQAAPTHGCGVNLPAPEIQAAIDSVPPVPQRPWEHNPRTFEGNYNPCATLSTALITIQAATRSSPQQALLFHDGNYVGTATSKAYGLVSLNTARTTDDTVALNYKDYNTSPADANPTIVTVRYQWQGDRVAMLDPPPPWPTA